jgi:hypothetical protein
MAEVQTPPGGKLRKIYDFLKTKKVKVHNTYEEFESSMNDKKLQKVYDFLKQQPKVKVHESYDDFKSSLLPKEQAPETPSLTEGTDPLTQGIQSSQKAAANKQVIPEVDIQAPEGILAEQYLPPSDRPASVPTEQDLMFKDQLNRQESEASAKDLVTDLNEVTSLEKADEVGRQVTSSFNKAVVSGLASIPKAVAIGGKQIDEFLGLKSGEKPIEEYPTYQLGQWLEDKALQIGATATDPKKADSFWQSKVPSAFGTVAAILLTGGRNLGAKAGIETAVTTPKGLLGKYFTDAAKTVTGASTVTGGTSMAVPEFEQAKAAGKTDDEAFDVFLKNYFVGQTEVIPIANALKRVNQLSGGRITSAITAGLKGGVEEATQEAVQTYLTNKIAQGSYDPKRDSFKDIIDATGAGFFVGFILPGVGAAMQKMTPEQKSETQKVLKDKFTQLKNEKTTEQPSVEEGTTQSIPESELQQPTHTESSGGIEETVQAEQPAVVTKSKYETKLGEIEEINTSIEKLRSENPKEFTKSGQPRANSKIKSNYRALVDMRDQRMDDIKSDMEEEFARRAEIENEISREETAKINEEFEKRQKELSKYVPEDPYYDEDEKLFDQINDILSEAKERDLLDNEVMFLNENAFKPVGFIYDNTGSLVREQSQSAEGTAGETQTSQENEVKTKGRKRDKKTLLTPPAGDTGTPAVQTPEENVVQGVQSGEAGPTISGQAEQPPDIGAEAERSVPDTQPEEPAGSGVDQEIGEAIGFSEGEEVQFEWLGETRVGKVIGKSSTGKVRIRVKGGTIFPIAPKGVTRVNADVKKARPKTEEKVVEYNSKRHKPIGIVGDPSQGFMFQTDLGKNIAKFFQKQFTSKGFLPQSVFDKWIQTRGQIGKYEAQVKFTLDDFKKAVKSEYAGKPTDAQITDMNLALQGKQPSKPIPPKVDAIIKDMRAQIDNLSQRFISEGIVAGEMSATFTKNLGAYITRSYRKHDDPFWAEFVPDQVKNQAMAFLRGQYPSHSQEEMEGLLNYLMYSPEAPAAILKGSKLGSKDLSILKRRGDIAPELRALMGEYGDPLLNYARTITKMANLVAKHHFLEDVKTQGMGVFLFDKPTGKYFAPIAAEGSKTMAPLNGLYTSEELAEAFNEFNSMEPMADWLKWYMKAISFVKAGKTVFSIMTHARNLFGNAGFVIANAHWRVDKIGKAFQVAFANIHSDDKAIREKFKEYVELMVVRDSSSAGELKHYIKDITGGKDFFEKINESRLIKLSRATKDTAENLYQAEDDLFKIYAFENELERYKKAFPDMPEQQVKEKVARIVRDTYPTYSMVPKIVKALRANPLVATFVSFPSEVLRTTYNTFALAKEELSSPSTRSIGAQRLAGIMTALTITTGASYATMAFLGLDGEDDEDLHKFVAPWQKTSEFLYLDVKDDKYKIIDMGYSDPHGYLKRPLYAFLREEDMLRGAINSAKALAEPFVSEQILTERLIDITRNEKKSGDHVYNPDAPIGDQAADIYNHLAEAGAPGTYTSLKRMLQAAGEKTDKYGNKYELTNEAVALFSGQREETKDITQALLFRAYELKDRIDKTDSDYFRVDHNKAATPEEKAAAKRERDAAMKKIVADAVDIYYSAIRLGVDPKDARRSMIRTKSPEIFKAIKGQ